MMDDLAFVHDLAATVTALGCADFEPPRWIRDQEHASDSPASVLPRTALAGDQFDKMRANSVAMLLRAGALPGHLTLVEQQVIQAAAKP